jgi:hypothetical protein
VAISIGINLDFKERWIATTTPSNPSGGSDLWILKEGIYITGGDEPSFGEYCNKAILCRKKVYKRRETS